MESIKTILKYVCVVLAFLFTFGTIGFFVYPFVKAFLLYQGGLQEQEAFNGVVIPLILKGWGMAFVSGLLGGAALRGFFFFKNELP